VIAKKHVNRVINGGKMKKLVTLVTLTVGVLITCSVYAAYVTFEDFNPPPDPPPNVVEMYLGSKGFGQFGMNESGIQIIDTDSSDFTGGVKSYQVTLDPGSDPQDPPYEARININQNTFLTGPQISINSAGTQYVEAAFKFMDNPGDNGDFQDFTVSMIRGLGPQDEKGYRASFYRNYGSGSHAYINLKYYNGSSWVNIQSTEVTNIAEETWFTLRLDVIDVGGYARLDATLKAFGGSAQTAFVQTNQSYGLSSYYSNLRGGAFGIEQLDYNQNGSGSIVYRMDNLTVNPEPATCLMFVSSLLGLGLKMKRRYSKK
jgi:hypothetical protein